MNILQKTGSMTEKAMRTEEIKEKLKKTLDSERYQHSLSAADTARQYAAYLNYDEEKAYLAGLVHDCAKYLTAEEYLSEARKFGIEPDEIQRLSPHLLHAPLGAKYAQAFYDVHDEEILSAVAAHTTGKADMSLLDKIIFTADLAEPLREYDDIEKIRELVFTDFDKALLLTLEGVLLSVLRKKQLIHPDTVLAYNWALSQF